MPYKYLMESCICYILNKVDGQIDYSWHLFKSRPVDVSPDTIHVVIQGFTMFEWRSRPTPDWKLKNTGLQSVVFHEDGSITGTYMNNTKWCWPKYPTVKQ